MAQEDYRLGRRGCLVPGIDPVFNIGLSLCLWATVVLLASPLVLAAVQPTLTSSMLPLNGSLVAFGVIELEFHEPIGLLTRGGSVMSVDSADSVLRGSTVDLRCAVDGNSAVLIPVFGLDGPITMKPTSPLAFVPLPVADVLSTVVFNGQRPLTASASSLLQLIVVGLPTLASCEVRVSPWVVSSATHELLGTHTWLRVTSPPDEACNTTALNDLVRTATPIIDAIAMAGVAGDTHTLASLESQLGVILASDAVRVCGSTRSSSMSSIESLTSTIPSPSRHCLELAYGASMPCVTDDDCVMSVCGPTGMCMWPSDVSWADFVTACAASFSGDPSVVRAVHDASTAQALVVVEDSTVCASGGSTTPMPREVCEADRTCNIPWLDHDACGIGANHTSTRVSYGVTSPAEPACRVNVPTPDLCASAGGVWLGGVCVDPAGTDEAACAAGCPVSPPACGDAVYVPSEVSHTPPDACELTPDDCTGCVVTMPLSTGCPLGWDAAPQCSTSVDAAGVLTCRLGTLAFLARYGTSDACHADNVPMFLSSSAPASDDDLTTTDGPGLASGNGDVLAADGVTASPSELPAVAGSTESASPTFTATATTTTTPTVTVTPSLIPYYGCAVPAVFWDFPLTTPVCPPGMEAVTNDDLDYISPSATGWCMQRPELYVNYPLNRTNCRLASTPHYCALQLYPGYNVNQYFADGNAAAHGVIAYDKLGSSARYPRFLTLELSKAECLANRGNYQLGRFDESVGAWLKAPMPSATQSISSSRTPSVSYSMSYSATDTASKSFTATATTSVTATVSATVTTSPTVTVSATVTRTTTATVTTSTSTSPSTTTSATVSATVTVTVTRTTSVTKTTSATASTSTTYSASVSATSTASQTWSASYSFSATASASASASATTTRSASASASVTATVTASATVSRTTSATVTTTASTTTSATVTATPTVTATNTPIPYYGCAFPEPVWGCMPSQLRLPVTAVNNAGGVASGTGYMCTEPANAFPLFITQSACMDGTQPKYMGCLVYNRTAPPLVFPVEELPQRGVYFGPNGYASNEIPAGSCAAPAAAPLTAMFGYLVTDPMPTPTPSRSWTSTPTPSTSAYSRTITRSATVTVTASKTATATVTPTKSMSMSVTRTATFSASASASPTVTASASASPTAGLTPSPTYTASGSPTFTASPTTSASASATTTASQSNSPSPTFSATRSQTRSASKTKSVTRTATATASVTATDTATPTKTYSASASDTATVTPTRSPSTTTSATVSASASRTYSATTSASATFTQSPSTTKSRKLYNGCAFKSPFMLMNTHTYACPPFTASLTSMQVTGAPVGPNKYCGQPLYLTDKVSISQDQCIQTGTYFYCVIAGVGPGSDWDGLSATYFAGANATQMGVVVHSPEQPDITDKTFFVTTRLSAAECVPAGGWTAGPAYGTGYWMAVPYPSSTPTPSATRTTSRTATTSATYSGSFTASASATTSRTYSATASQTFTVTPSYTVTRTTLPTLTITPSTTFTASSTFSVTPSTGSSLTATSTATQSPTSTSTATASATVSPTVTPTPTGSRTFSKTRSATTTATFTSTFSASHTFTATPTPSPTFTATATATVSRSFTATPAVFYGCGLQPMGETCQPGEQLAPVSALFGDDSVVFPGKSTACFTRETGPFDYYTCSAPVSCGGCRAPVTAIQTFYVVGSFRTVAAPTGDGTTAIVGYVGTTPMDSGTCATLGGTCVARVGYVLPMSAPTASASISVTPTNTATISETKTTSATKSPTFTASASVSPTTSASASPTQTVSVTESATTTPSYTFTGSASSTATVTTTATHTMFPSVTRTSTTSVTPSSSTSATDSASVTVSPSTSRSPTVSVTTTATATPTVSPTASVSQSKDVFLGCAVQSLYVAVGTSIPVCPGTMATVSYSIVTGGQSGLNYCAQRNDESDIYAYTPASCVSEDTPHYCVLSSATGVIDVGRVSSTYFGGAPVGLLGTVAVVVGTSSQVFLTNRLSPAQCVPAGGLGARLDGTRGYVMSSNIPSATPTVSDSSSPTPSETPSRGTSRTASPSATVTATTSASKTVSATVTTTTSASASVTASAVSSVSFTSSFTASASATATTTTSASTTVSTTASVTASPTTTTTTSATHTPTVTASDTVTGTRSQSFSKSVTASRTTTATTSATATVSVTYSATFSATATPTVTASTTGSTSRTITTSPTARASYTATFSSTRTASVTLSLSRTKSMTPTVTSSPSRTTASATQSRTSSGSATATRFFSNSQSSSMSFTVSVTSSRSSTQSRSFSKSATATVTASPTFTATATRTNTRSGSPSFTASASPSPSAANSESVTITPSATFTASSSETPTSSLTQTISGTVTPTRTSSVTPSTTPGLFPGCAAPAVFADWTTNALTCPGSMVPISPASVVGTTTSLLYCAQRNTDVAYYSYTAATCTDPATEHYCVLKFKNALVDTAPGTSGLSRCYFNGQAPLSFGFVGYLASDESGPYFITNQIPASLCVSQDPCNMVKYQEAFGGNLIGVTLPTPSNSPPSSVSATVTITRTSSVSLTFTASGSPTRTGSTSVTRTRSVTSTWTPSVSSTGSALATPTITLSPSRTPTTTRSGTFTPTQSTTGSRSLSSTKTATRTYTPSASTTPTISDTPGIAPTVSVSESPTESPTISETPTITATVTPSYVTPSPSATFVLRSCVIDSTGLNAPYGAAPNCASMYDQLRGASSVLSPSDMTAGGFTSSSLVCVMGTRHWTPSTCLTPGYKLCKLGGVPLSEVDRVIARYGPGQDPQEFSLSYNTSLPVTITSVVISQAACVGYTDALGFTVTATPVFRQGYAGLTTLVRRLQAPVTDAAGTGVSAVDTGALGVVNRALWRPATQWDAGAGMCRCVGEAGCSTVWYGRVWATPTDTPCSAQCHACVPSARGTSSACYVPAVSVGWCDAHGGVFHANSTCVVRDDQCATIPGARQYACSNEASGHGCEQWLSGHDRPDAAVAVAQSYLGCRWRGVPCAGPDACIAAGTCVDGIPWPVLPPTSMAGARQVHTGCVMPSHAGCGVGWTPTQIGCVSFTVPHCPGVWVHRPWDAASCGAIGGLWTAGQPLGVAGTVTSELVPTHHFMHALNADALEAVWSSAISPLVALRHANLLLRVGSRALAVASELGVASPPQSTWLAIARMRMNAPVVGLSFDGGNLTFQPQPLCGLACDSTVTVARVWNPPTSINARPGRLLHTLPTSVDILTTAVNLTVNGVAASPSYRVCLSNLRSTHATHPVLDVATWFTPDDEALYPLGVHGLLQGVVVIDGSYCADVMVVGPLVFIARDYMDAVACSPGHGLVDGVCVPCMSGFFNPQVGSVCIRCPTSTTTSTAGSVVCSPCAGAACDSAAYAGSPPTGSVSDRTWMVVVAVSVPVGVVCVLITGFAIRRRQRAAQAKVYAIEPIGV